MARTRPVLPLAVLVAMVTACGGAVAPPMDMAGSWKGIAKVSCSWCKQHDLAVELTIAADGAVQGRLGEATLSGARLERNTTPPGKRVGAPTRYVIEAKLSGPISAAEKISRDSVSIYVDIAGSSLIGGFRTSGTETGGRESALLAGSIEGLSKT